MNRLGENNYIHCESCDIRNNMLEDLKDNGYNMDNSTMEERDDDGDYEKYPIIRWTGDIFSVQSVDDTSEWIEITIGRFRELTELTPPTAHRGSRLIHNFVHK